MKNLKNKVQAVVVTFLTVVTLSLTSCVDDSYIIVTESVGPPAVIEPPVVEPDPSELLRILTSRVWVTTRVIRIPDGTDVTESYENNLIVGYLYLRADGTYEVRRMDDAVTLKNFGSWNLIPRETSSSGYAFEIEPENLGSKFVYNIFELNENVFAFQVNIAGQLLKFEYTALL